MPDTPNAPDEATIREVLATDGELGAVAREIDRDADLFDAGLTSVGAVAVVVGLEERFGLEFDLASLFLDAVASVAGVCDLVAAAAAAAAPAGRAGAGD